MRRKTIALAAVTGMLIAACGTPGSGAELPEDPNAPVLQIRSEGGFAPVEFILGAGPIYTLLADGTLISEGPVIAIYPGPLLPNYLVNTINADQMNTVLELIDEVGLPDIEEEIDDNQASNVADANTTVATYWDPEGNEHVYGVYALGLEEDESEQAQALADLIEALGQMAASSEAVPYEGETVRVVMGEGFTDPDFEDIRDWPLGETDLSTWFEYPNGWLCETYGPEIIPIFEDATQATTWVHPDPVADNPPVKLLVRYLHPGEPDCDLNE